MVDSEGVKDTEPEPEPEGEGEGDAALDVVTDCVALGVTERHLVTVAVTDGEPLGVALPHWLCDCV